MRALLQSTWKNVRGGERGITGLETAIILIAFVVVATVFAFIVLTTGIFSAERGKETVFAGLAKARGTMEVRGGIIVTRHAPGRGLRSSSRFRPQPAATRSRWTPPPPACGPSSPTATRR